MVALLVRGAISGFSKGCSAGGLVVEEGWFREKSNGCGDWSRAGGSWETSRRELSGRASNAPFCPCGVGVGPWVTSVAGTRLAPCGGGASDRRGSWLPGGGCDAGEFFSSGVATMAFGFVETPLRG